ncbi:MAG TPA: prenyltransferase/squalene oxidase repeat-containing protein [Planctomycetota bacterium]|nr:prenyltransferase/squalene oxidase repeat-containing protein [Planctomycetota bacterium]
MSELDQREGSEDGPVVISQEGGLLSNAPWWLVSVGLHLVLVLGATLVVVERLGLPDDATVEVVVRQALSTPLFDKIEAPLGSVTRKGPILDKPDTGPDPLPDVFIPDAKFSDHYESDDNEDTKSIKGDSKDYLSYMPGEAGGIRGRQVGKVAGVYDTMGTGIGGGGGGKYGTPWGGRDRLKPRPKGTTRGTEDAVLSALKWLAHHQGPDGGWGAVSFAGQCSGGRCSGEGDATYDTGVTGLSLLAFLGAGFSPLSKDEFPDPIDPQRTLRFGETVKRGLQWLIAHQDPEGCVGERGAKHLYNHAVAALALSEAYGMTASIAVRDPAQKAIDFLIAAQNPGKAWRYGAKCGDNDSSVTGWAVMALKSAELSELAFPRAAAFDGALNWFTEATSAKDGYYRVGYNARDTGKVYVPGKNEQWDDHPALSAVAVMSRIFVQKNKKEPALTAVQLLVSDLPEWKPFKVDFYYWYYASLALFQYDGPEGGLWSKWNEPMKNAIVPHQKGKADGCKVGSWDPENDRWGFEGGRVYAAAINALTLEVYYRYANVFGGGAAKH